MKRFSHFTVAKQNSVSELVSKALNDKISDNEFNLILCELKKYYELKTAIRSKMVSRSQPQQPDVEKKKKKQKRDSPRGKRKNLKKNIVLGHRVEFELERLNSGFKLCLTKERMLNYK